MIREVKSITLGSAYDFIDLSKYTNNKDSITVKFEATDKFFTNWTLDDFGHIKIASGVIDYKQYENPYRIQMIVEYEPSKLPLSLEDIDTLDGLRRNIVDLKSLDYISDIRLVANRKFDIRLHEFVLFNSIIFDTFGQTMKLEYENMDKYNYSMSSFITMEEFREKINSFSMCSGYIPSADAVCPHCKQRWNLNNLGDCIRRGDHLYHRDCNKFSLYEKSKKEFDYVASIVFHNYGLRAVRNEYGSEEYNGYWFIISTNDGDIKIGWRKRVIQIEWMESYKPFKYDAQNEEVTKKFSNKERYIHADNTQKAMEYLRRAKETIIK